MIPNINPPTDNLYKFLAISGLVLIAFSIYVPMQLWREAIAVATKYTAENAKWSAELQTFSHSVHPDLKRDKDAEPETFPMLIFDYDDRLRLSDYYKKSADELLLYTLYTSRQDIQAVLRSEKVRKKVTEKLKGTDFTDEQYAKALEEIQGEELDVITKEADAEIAPLVEKARELRPQIMQARANVVLTWQALDAAQHSQTWSFYFQIVGVVTLVSGFGLWYIKVQRPQDQLLTADLNKKLKEAQAEPVDKSEAKP